MDLRSLQTRYANGDAPVDVALHVLNCCKTKPELNNSFVSFASEDQVKQFSADAEAISPTGRYTIVTLSCRHIGSKRAAKKETPQP